MPAYERRPYRTAAATPAAATALPLQKNVVNPKVVSKMLGHSAIAITINTHLDTYSHPVCRSKSGRRSS